VIRILLVADIRLYREGLAQILGRERSLSVVGAVADFDSALAAARALQPDVVLIDEATPDSCRMIRAIRTQTPELKVVALAVQETDKHVLDCAEAGVAGFVPRDAGVSELLATLQSVGRGELLCSPRMAATLLRRVTTLAGITPLGTSEARLTAREVEILQLLGQGFSNKDIARQLGIEVATAKNHVHNILEKLGVNRRHEAAERVRAIPLRSSAGTGATELRR